MLVLRCNKVNAAFPTTDSCFRRSKVTFTPDFKSVPKLVRFIPPRVQTKHLHFDPLPKEDTERVLAFPIQDEKSSTK